MWYITPEDVAQFFFVTPDTFDLKIYQPTENHELLETSNVIVEITINGETHRAVITKDAIIKLFTYVAAHATALNLSENFGE